MAGNETSCHFEFQALPGFFVNFTEKAQQDPFFQARTLPGLGLLDRPYETDNITRSDKSQENFRKPWERFRVYVEHLNGQYPGSTIYKVLYITRHGLGYHNVFESRVGRDAWNVSHFCLFIAPIINNHGQDHWSHLDGDGQVIWADSQLNEDGVEQAKALGRFWSDAVANEKVPIPGTIYTSPLTRCLETTRLVFAKAVEEQVIQFRPIVKELLRERLTNHTCDRRSSRGWIKEHFPNYDLEPGFSEEDRLWTGGRWESAEEHMARKHRVLEDIFATDENAFVALTVHSYAISAILGVIRLAEFRVQEGNSIAFLVKAERIGSRS